MTEMTCAKENERNRTLLLHFRDESKCKLRIWRNHCQLAQVMKNLGLHRLNKKFRFFF